MIEEIWKSIEGYPKYEVSNLGNIRSLNYRHTNKVKILKPHTNNNGYLLINLYQMGKMKTVQIHRLVAETFIPNPDNLPVVNHKDENKHNNCVDNLEWCTHKYNSNYGTAIERQRQKIIGRKGAMLGRFGKLHNHSKPINQYDLEGKFIRSWDCAADVKRELGYSNQNISSCALGKTKSANGYVWRYE